MEAWEGLFGTQGESAMNPLIPQLLAGLLAFTGLPAGALLARFAREEVSSPMAGQYFRALRGVIAALILWMGVGGLAALFPFIGPMGQFALTLGTLLILTRRKAWGAAYALWGLLLGLLAVPGASGALAAATPPMTLMAGLVFLYGLVEAALRPVRGQKEKGLAAAGVAGLDLLFFAFFIAGVLLAGALFHG